MTRLSTFEYEIAELIINTLQLEDITPTDIEPKAPLFGEGLGLDSIDALEIALAISRCYHFQLKADDSRNRQIFASLADLAEHIQNNRKDQ